MPRSGFRLLSPAIAASLVIACTGAPQSSPTAPATPAVTATATPADTPTASPYPAPTAAATATPAARVFTSDDGLLTMEVPAGAIPDEVVLTATAGGTEDLPPELAGIQMRSAFYSLEPDGLTFAEPVTITRRASLEQLGWDLATDGLPLITLALRTSDGEWAWLDEQEVTTDGEFVTVSGNATHTSQVFAFGGTNFVRYGFSDDDLQVPVGASFELNATVTYPSSASKWPVVADREPFTHTGSLVAGGGGLYSDALPGLYQGWTCQGPGMVDFGVRFDVGNLGAGSTLYEQLGLPSPTEAVYLEALAICLAADASATPGGAPTPTAGCVIVVHTAFGDFISHLRMELDFGGGPVRRVEVTVEGANDNQPVVGEFDEHGFLVALLGLRQAGRKELKKVEVTTIDGTTHDVTQLAAALIFDGAEFNVPFPQEPTYGSCPSDL